MIGTVMNQKYKLKPTVSILETTQKSPTLRSLQTESVRLVVRKKALKSPLYYTHFIKKVR